MSSGKVFIDLIQDVARCTWIYHLSHRQRRTVVLSSMLFSAVVKLRVFRLCLWCHRSNGSWHSHCGGAAAFRVPLVPTFRHHAWLNERRPRTPCHISWVRGVWWLEQARVSWTFPRPHSIWQKWHCHSPHQSTAYHPGSRKLLPHQAWCHITHGTSCGTAAYTVTTGWSFCQQHYSRQHKGTCQISGGHPGHHQRPNTWSYSCWYGALYFPCEPSKPWAWRCFPLGCTQWAPGHQHREAAMVHQCETHACASITRMMSRWLRT